MKALGKSFSLALAGYSAPMENMKRSLQCDSMLLSCPGATCLDLEVSMGGAAWTNLLLSIRQLQLKLLASECLIAELTLQVCQHCSQAQDLLSKGQRPPARTHSSTTCRKRVCLTHKSSSLRGTST